MNKYAKNKIAVKIFHKAIGIATWLQDIPKKVTPEPFRLMQISSSFWQSRALYVVVRLDIADFIGDDQFSVSNIASANNLSQGHLYRCMRMLSSLGIFHEISPQLFKNNKASNYLRSDNPNNIRAMILMHNSPEMTRPWTESLEKSIREGGIPFEISNGNDLYRYMDNNKEFDILFSQAMDSVENLTGSTCLKDFNWSAFNRIIDVGGSKGKKALSILKSNPNIEALVFDRPQIINSAQVFWQDKVDSRVLKRIRFEAGDMFERIPVAESNHDLYTFFAVFHGFSDTQALQVFRNLKQASNGYRPYSLVVDAVASESDIDSTIASFDMQMLIGTQGRERTRSEWHSLLNDAEFDIISIMDVRTFAKFILIRPR